jgi:hypothetical protein
LERCDGETEELIACRRLTEQISTLLDAHIGSAICANEHVSCHRGVVERIWIGPRVDHRPIGCPERDQIAVSSVLERVREDYASIRAEGKPSQCRISFIQMRLSST